MKHSLLATSIFLFPLMAWANPGLEMFTQKIQPILESSCVSCHNGEKSKGELKLHTLADAMKGGESGLAIVPGKPEESLLLKRVVLPKEDEDVMPPADKGELLNAEQIETLKQWITQGAPWPDGLVLVAKEKPAPPGKETVTPVRSIAVYPDKVLLETNRDFHRMVVVATFEDDVCQDITSRAQYALADASLAKWEDFTLTGLKDGQTTLAVSWQGKTVDVPVTVTKAAEGRPISYYRDVMPIFMRDNCNTGSCHGSARGQDGFRLSLFGYDPKGDHYRLTQEMSGRRVNFAVPADSLLLTKAVNEVPHSGGKKFEKDSATYRTLVEWIEQGAPEDSDASPKPVNLEIFPRNALLEGLGANLQFTVRATYSDGTDRDVTKSVLFSSNNDPTARASRDGLVTAGNRGEAFIMARFETHTVGAQVVVIPENLKYERPKPPETNYIDPLVHNKLHKLRLIPSGNATDEAFIRRAYLDICGLLPRVEDLNRFTADAAPNKREMLVDELLGRKEFTDLWVMKWAELLQIRTNANNQVSYKSTLLYFNWLKERIAKNMPFNEIVQELLASNGGTFTSPATNYYQIERDTLKVTENVAQVFMGMRLQCAQCHNHPFDRWTMNDYYGFASFFTQVGRKQAEDPREIVVFNSGGGEFPHPVTKAPVPPKFLGGEAPKLEGADRRKLLAQWLASPQNPYFAKNLANIVWSHFFGVGIIDPVDDVRISNPASNPELLDALGAKFTEYNYDFKRLVRDICLSATYQRTTQVNESNAQDEMNFSHSLIRRQRAEIMLDAIAQVTETTTSGSNKFQGLPLGARAVQIADGNVSNYFLRTFGRAERTTVCSCEVKMDPSLSQALHLLNGDITHQRIGEGAVVKKLIEAKMSPEQVIEVLYQRCFSRKPTPAESGPAVAAIAAAPDQTQAVLEDVFWALLNSKEFMFNH